MKTIQLATIGLLLLGQLSGAGLRRVREIRLTQHVETDTMSFGEEQLVKGLAFSPDENWLAVVVGLQSSILSETNQVLLVARERQTNEVKYLGEAGSLPSDRQSFARISWSPGGDYLAIGTVPPTVLRLADNTSCRLTAPALQISKLGGFISGDRIIAAQTLSRDRPPDQHDSSKLVLFDPDCRPQYYRDIPGRITSLDADSSSGRVAIGFLGGSVAMFDAKAGHEVARWHGEGGDDVGLLDGGNVVCVAGLPTKHHRSPQCWSAEHRDQAPRSPKAWGGVPFSVSSHSALAVFSDGVYSYDSFLGEEQLGIKRDVLWDYQSSNTVLTRGTRRQPCELGFSMVPECRLPFALALSPSGRYMAEAGNGTLSVYEIKK